MRNLVVLFLSLFLTHCGTDLGNPGARGDSTDNTNPSPTLGSLVGTIVQPMCSVLNRCHSVVLETCTSSIAEKSNIVSSLNLDTTKYADFNAVVSANLDGELNRDTNQESVCSTALSNLSCSSGLLASSFSSLAPEDFNQVYQLLSVDNACSAIYSEAQ